MQAGLRLCCSQTMKTGFHASRPICEVISLVPLLDKRKNMYNRSVGNNRGGSFYTIVKQAAHLPENVNKLMSEK